MNVLIQHPEPMRTKLRKKMFPGESALDPDAINKETKKIIDQISVFAKRERIIS